MEYIGHYSLEEDYRINLTKKIAYELENEEFRSRSKDGQEGVFVRVRKLTISSLIFIIIGFKSSIQRELDTFFKEVLKKDFEIRTVSKGGFTQARAKLSPWAFIRLNEVAVDEFYNNAEYYVWHGMRVVAVDGTRLVLPNHKSIIEEFGLHKFGPKADSKRSLAIGSLLYDVLNQVTIDAQMAPYSSSESALLSKHLGKLKKGDLLLLDRGYPSIWLLFLLTAMGIEFVIRMKENWWKKVGDFTDSDEIERMVTFELPKKDYKKLAAFPHMIGTTITCRLIKVILENGDKEILCTSLIDTEKFKHEEFEGLYHRRWGVEEAYKLLKSRIELEDFSGKTANAVKQDFHAKVFLMTLCAVYAHPIEEKVKEEYKADENRKYDQQINRTNAISMTMNILIPMFFRKQIENALYAFDAIVLETREIIRPDRSNPRNHKPKIPYSMNYKRL